MTPKSLLLVHGAGSGPWVFDGWSESFPDLELTAPDLQEGLDVARASMDDYMERVAAEGNLLSRPLALCGWSMGGLVAMKAVSKLNPEALILIEASAPGEVQGFNEQIDPRRGVFDSERVYGARFRLAFAVAQRANMRAMNANEGFLFPHFRVPPSLSPERSIPKNVDGSWLLFTASS